MRPLRWPLTLGILSAALACNALVGIPGTVAESPGPDATAMDGSDAAADPPDAADAAPALCSVDAAMGNLCHECRDEYCCDVFVACHDSTACGDYIDCAAACTTSACTLACIKNNPEGHAIASPYIACGQLHCPGQCGAEDAGACLTCEEAYCAMQVYTCLADPGCNTLTICNSTCAAGDEACLQACNKGVSSNSEALYNDTLVCSFTYCVHQCATQAPSGDQ
jgi:hypothetical protein